MIEIIFESIKSIYSKRSVYFKRVISVMISVAVVIIIQCISFNMVEQLSDKNTRKEEKITIEVINKERKVEESELLNPIEITEIVNLSGKCMRIIYEEWEEAVICKFCNMSKVQITAVTRGYVIQNGEKVIEGRSFNKEDEEFGLPRVMISDDLSKKIFGIESAVGRKLQFATDEHGMIEAEIIGVYEVEDFNETHSEKYIYEIYINYGYLNNNNMIEDDKSGKLEYYVNVNRTDEIKKLLYEYFDARYDKAETIYVITNELNDSSNSNRIVELVMKVIQSFAILAFVISNLGIMNLSLMDIEKRIKEIGIRMAVGAEPKHIIIQIVTECVSLSLIGALIGIVIGFLCGSIINIFICLKYKDILSSFIFYMPWKVAIYSAVGSLLIGLVFSIIPAKKASNIVIIKVITMKD